MRWTEQEWAIFLDAVERAQHGGSYFMHLDRVGFSIRGMRQRIAALVDGGETHARAALRAIIEEKEDADRLAWELTMTNETAYQQRKRVHLDDESLTITVTTHIDSNLKFGVGDKVMFFGVPYRLQAHGVMDGRRYWEFAPCKGVGDD